MNTKEKDGIKCMCDTKSYFNDIKSIQDLLRKKGLQRQYLGTILGFTILRRLTQTLDSTRNEVVLEYERMKAENFVDEDLLIAIANEKFYNVSRFNFANLQNDVQHIYKNTLEMIRGFSNNVYEILGKDGLDLESIVDIINEKGILFQVIQKFEDLDFSRKAMSNANMGALFSQLIVMLYGTPENGENWTPDDFVKLCTKLLLAEGCDWLKTGSSLVKVCDHAIGSGQLLSNLESEIHKMNKNISIKTYGQDNQRLNIAICKAEQLMSGHDTNNLYVADSLKEDNFGDTLMDFSLQNAPYGCGREKDDEEAIKAYLGEDLPSSSDNQMLFWKAMIKKLKPTGRAVFLSNGSPLFSGSTNSGESKIRQWLLSDENDYVEAIIKLPDSSFLDTGITIYAWVINKSKPAHRKHLVQLIDASSFYHPMKKSVGQKRKNMEDSDIESIVKLYTDFRENEYSKIFDTKEFLYYEVTVNQPYQRNFMITVDRINNLYSNSAFNKLFNKDKYQELLDKDATPSVLKDLKALDEGKEQQEHILSVLNANISDKRYINRDEFTKAVKSLFPELKPVLIKAIVTSLSEKDKTSDIYKDKKGNIEADSELKDTEYVPFKENVDDYFNREVKPFVLDAWYLDNYKNNVGCEISFDKYFYKYVEPRSSKEIMKEFLELENKVNSLMGVLFNE